jgi:LAS superfamily LD-carboxypeptidase LdcB
MRAKKILEYSSMPGSSRHHWGTDIDLNNFENDWFETGEGLKMYQWMENHAAEYGFCQPYSKKDAQRPNGYNEEKWHWSYTPLAKKYTDAAAAGLKDSMLGGFEGAVAAKDVEIVRNYVLGINKACL